MQTKNVRNQQGEKVKVVEYYVNKGRNVILLKINYPLLKLHYTSLNKYLKQQ